MEKVDKQLEKRVWQRVQARPDLPQVPARESLKPWVLVAQENTAVLRGLQLQLIGKQWEGLRRLEGDSARMVQALRGVSLMQGEPVKLTPIPTPREQPRRALEKSFHRTRRLREALLGRCADPEYGAVFHSLTAKCDDLCAALAEMIGRLDI